MGKSFGILLKTMPYLIMRTVAYSVFGLISLVYVGVVVGIIAAAAHMFGENAGLPVVVLVIVAALGFFGLVKLAERLVFYAIKAGHVAVITELITHGELPAGVNQVEFGRQAVSRHFGTMAVFAAVDALVEGAVRQVLGWLTAAASMLSFVPGIDFVWGIARSILSVAGNYVDEAILSYILCHPGNDVWRMAADGVVLYAQAWKKLIAAAVVVVVVVAAVWIVAAAPFFLIGLAAVNALQIDPGFAWIVALVPAAIAGGIARSIIADPLATVLIVSAYHEAIVQMTPGVDMYAKLQGASRKFKQLSDRAQQPLPAPAA